MNTIINLAVSNNKNNKTRSSLIVLSITLTTMLLTIIVCFCNGIIKSNKANASQMYGSYFGIYKNVSEEQIKEMELRNEFSDIGRIAYAGEVKNEKDSRLYWVDEVTRKLINISKQIESGNYPEREQEIAAEKSFFQSLGYTNPQIGDEISLESRIDSEHKFAIKQFIISGFIQESTKKSAQGKTNKSYIAYISNSFYENEIEAKNKAYNVYFRLRDNKDITSDNAEEVLKKLAGKCGITESQVSANDYYLMCALDPGTDTIVVGILISLCVIIFSVVVIYNIFLVGLAQKVHEYGKLKGIGTTKKQLATVVKIEGMLLSVVGIPIGLVIGCLVSKYTFNWLMDQAASFNSGVKLKDISIFSAPLLIAVVIIAVLTTRIALQKPIKIVSKISPINAMRYQENTNDKKSLRRGHKSINIKTMILANMSSNKRRTITTICTMGLSCVLFVIVANFIGNIDVQYDARQSIEHGQYEISLDYALRDSAYPENNLDRILEANPLGADLIEKIRAIDGVTDVKIRKILAMKEMERDKKIGDLSSASKNQTGGLVSVAVLDREDFAKYVKNSEKTGTFDYDTVSEQNAILFGSSFFMKEYGYFINQDIEADLYNGNNHVSYQGEVIGAFGNCDQKWVITDETYQNLKLNDGGNGYVWVDCAEENSPEVKAALNELLSDVQHVEVNSYDDVLKESQMSCRYMKLMVYFYLVILGIIGFMNMANTMIVSIVTRKQELGVLQAIGMTNHQLNRMLQAEGLIYTIGTIAVAMLVGIPFGYALFLYGKDNGWIGLNVYHFPWLEIMLMVVVIGLLQMILSFVLSRNIRNESLVERIQYRE